jgi:hypothetical protein
MLFGRQSFLRNPRHRSGTHVPISNSRQAASLSYASAGTPLSMTSVNDDAGCRAQPRGSADNQ